MTLPSVTQQVIFAFSLYLMFKFQFGFYPKFRPNHSTVCSKGFLLDNPTQKLLTLRGLNSPLLLELCNQDGEMEVQEHG